jgi:hypothetical protein
LIPTIFEDSDIQTLIKLYQANTSSVVNIEDFKEDIMRFVYIFRLINRYNEKDILNYRLLLNHIIILYNVFGNLVTNILMENSTIKNNKQIYTLLFYVERLPEEYFDHVDEVMLRKMNERSKENSED